MDRVKDSPAVTIRQPATANLMVDSKDRSQGTWGNFQITRSQSILNGFFTRIATTEIVLEWAEQNINDGYTDFSIDIGGNDVATMIPTGFYTVERMIDELKAAMTASLQNETAPLDGYSFQYNNLLGFWVSDTGDDTGNPVAFSINDEPLLDKLKIPNAATATTYHPIIAPDLRLYRYIDIVSSQLTYNQDLKDAATTQIVRDVLARWYFAYDTQTTNDAYGFPILQGYQPFVLRRTYSPPKQIRWDNIQPVGNIAFQVYDDAQQLIQTDDDNQYLITLQVSEN